MINDTYKTIKVVSEGLYKEKGSKFIAIAFPIFSEEDFKEKLKNIKQEYHDARHHCYAYRLGANMNHYRFNDDGEPNNSAGKPIFGQIQSFKLSNIAIIVVRYFGGIKLGVGGLITAYKEAAKNALINAIVINRTVDNIYEIQFDYTIMSDVMNFIKKNNLEVVSQQLEETGLIQFKIRQSKAQTIVDRFEIIKGLKVLLIS